jgi:hypothetical protein
MLIGLTGKARSGKTTIAEHWRERYGFEIISFADALKEMVTGALTVNPPPQLNSFPEWRYDTQFPIDWRRYVYEDRTPFTRWLLQFIGTDIVRSRINTAFWTEQGTYKIDTALRRGAMVVIPDLRFINESLVVRAFSGDIVRVVRTDGEAKIEAGAAHASEVEQDDVIEDRKLVCASGREKLLEEADKLLGELRSVH